MALPGSRDYPPANTELEAQNQVVKLLFRLHQEFNALRSELQSINTSLQDIARKLH
jgi:hypothetical protein